MDGFGAGDGLDMDKNGSSLRPEEWHNLIIEKKKQDALQNSPSPSTSSPITIIDCRNYYETDVGRFEGAIRLEIDKHLDAFDELDKLLQGKEEEKIMIVPSFPSSIISLPACFLT